MIDEQVRALLEAPNVVHVATLMPDGGPHSVAVWAGMEGERVCFFTQPRSRKARNLEHDPRVAMSVIDRQNPYRTGYLRGAVAETVEGDAALEIIDRLSVSYTGAPFPMRSGVVFLIEPTLSRLVELPFKPAG